MAGAMRVSRTSSVPGAPLRILIDQVDEQAAERQRTMHGAELAREQTRPVIQPMGLTAEPRKDPKITDPEHPLFMTDEERELYPDGIVSTFVLPAEIIEVLRADPDLEKHFSFEALDASEDEGERRSTVQPTPRDVEDEEQSGRKPRREKR